MVEYGYDAWGKPTKVWSLIHPSESTLTSEYGKLAQLNPFRYRGYVWDEETGLYYLRSRYYDPAWGRFLNIDSLFRCGTSTHDRNLFAYCSNSPVAQMDPEGHSAISIVSVLGLLYFVGIAGGVSENRSILSQQIQRYTDYVREIVYSKAKARAEERERIIAVTQANRTDAMYFPVVRLGPDRGIATLPDPMPFEAALGYTLNGEDVWTMYEKDAKALAEATGAVAFGWVDGPHQDSNRGAYHFHVHVLNRKIPMHIFFGLDYVDSSGLIFAEGDFS